MSFHTVEPDSVCMPEVAKELYRAHQTAHGVLETLKDACDFGSDSSCQEVLVARLMYAAWRHACDGFHELGYALNRIAEIDNGLRRKSQKMEPLEAKA